MFRPRPSEMIERYLQTGKRQLIVDLFDGGVELDTDMCDRLMAIDEKHLTKGDGMYGAFFHPEARDDLARLAKDLKAAGK